MACSCRGRRDKKFLWIPAGSSAESDDTILYNTEIEAKAKVLRKGGTYIPLQRSGDQYVALTG